MPTTSMHLDPAHHFDDALAVYIEAQTTLIMEPGEDERETDRLCDALTAAEDYVLRHQAPDLRCVLAKLEIATYDSGVPPPQYLDSIKADLMRLAELDRSPTFLPLVWLARFERAGGTTALTKGKEQAVVPQLGCPTDRPAAARMLSDLKDHEREALGEWLQNALDPADYGLANVRDEEEA